MDKPTPDHGDRSPAATRPSAFFNPAEVDTRRSMVLFGAGSLFGLAIAGYGLFTAPATSTRTVPPENVAVVNQRPILRSDFMTQLESETGAHFSETTRADQLKVLDEMVREELLVQRSLELGLAETDQDSRNALVNAVTQLATVAVATTQPTEQQLRSYFAKHQDRYASDGTMTVRHLLLPGRTGTPAEAAVKARGAVTALRAGTPPEQVMTQYGLLEPGRKDEDYYFAVKYRLGDALFERVRNLTDGAVAEPLAGADGIHIVQVVKNNRPVPQSFESSRTQVAADYKEAVNAQLLEATMSFLRGRAKILIAPDYAHEYQPTPSAPPSGGP